MTICEHCGGSGRALLVPIVFEARDFTVTLRARRCDGNDVYKKSIELHFAFSDGTLSYANAFADEAQAYAAYKVLSRYFDSLMEQVE